MKYKQKIDIIVALFLVLFGSIILVLPLFNITNIKAIGIIIFSIYTVLNIAQYILTYKSKDIEGVISAIASVVALIVTIVTKPQNDPRTLAMILMTWVIIMSIAKLHKADYYHDRRDRMWKVRVLNLGIFIIAGILTSINLAYTGEVQIIVVGFFLFIHGIVELFDPVTKYLIAHS
jgi:uncharacterized membrane protein HdeD (DUF308 family)